MPGAREPGPGPWPLTEDTTAGTVFAGKANAPEFPSGLKWVNTDRPLTLAELRGRLVVLDFWTYC